MKLKVILKGIIALLLGFVLVACSQGNHKMGQEAGHTAEKALKVGVSFYIESLDPHLNDNGWQTNIYGLTETLFKINDDLTITGLLAKEYKNDGRVWTIELKDGLVFSNGNKITSEVVIANLKRLGEMNERYKPYLDYDMVAKDDTTFAIDTKTPNPTLVNELASPEVAIIDIDNSKDFSTNLVASGPFMIRQFQPDGHVVLEKNKTYWNGEVKLDTAEIIYFQDPNAKQLALQNGEIDTYYDVRLEANEIFGSDDNYVISRVPGTRIQFMIFNEERLEPELRQAINLAINKREISEFLTGILTPTSSPFSEAAAYGKAKDSGFDFKAAKSLLESKGYTLNKDGFYEKDGKVLTLDLAYYAARSLDVTANLILEQLKVIGIDVKLSVYEDPDATYIASHDFDLALYSMIADKSGALFYFINATLKDGSYYDVGGFNNAEVEQLIGQLATESDSQKRADLANMILQKAMDDNAFNYLGLFSRSMVYRKGVSHLSETNPFDFYLLNAETDISQ